MKILLTFGSTALAGDLKIEIIYTGNLHVKIFAQNGDENSGGSMRTA
jgi:hypothetical protein